MTTRPLDNLALALYTAGTLFDAALLLIALIIILREVLRRRTARAGGAQVGNWLTNPTLKGGTVMLVEGLFLLPAVAMADLASRNILPSWMVYVAIPLIVLCILILLASLFVGWRQPGAST